jgi:hypothetical protein
VRRWVLGGENVLDFNTETQRHGDTEFFGGRDGEAGGGGRWGVLGGFGLTAKGQRGKGRRGGGGLGDGVFFGWREVEASADAEEAERRRGRGEVGFRRPWRGSQSSQAAEQQRG